MYWIVDKQQTAINYDNDICCVNRQIFTNTKFNVLHQTHWLKAKPKIINIVQYSVIDDLILSSLRSLTNQRKHKILNKKNVEP